MIAFDASRELAVLASQALGEPVEVMTLLDLDAVAEFDGVWACACLLHVPADEMDAVLNRFARALKPGAPTYVSFKYGSTEGYRNERLFNDYDEAKLQTLLLRHPHLSVEKLWQTRDVRSDHEHELWLNVILRNQQ